MAMTICFWRDFGPCFVAGQERTLGQDRTALYTHAGRDGTAFGVGLVKVFFSSSLVVDSARNIPGSRWDGSKRSAGSRPSVEVSEGKVVGIARVWSVHRVITDGRSAVAWEKSRWRGSVTSIEAVPEGRPGRVALGLSTETFQRE